MNFKKETLEAIEGSGHTKKDVMFIGSSDGKYRMNMETFLDASDFDYDAGFGAQEIASDLIVYFKDKSYMTRHEYDGAESWEYNSPKSFKVSDKFKLLKRLKVPEDRVGWETVEELANENQHANTKGRRVD